jgi:hypothetical protein
VDRAFLLLRVGRVEIEGKNNQEGGRYEGDGRRERGFGGDTSVLATNHSEQIPVLLVPTSIEEW